MSEQAITEFLEARIAEDEALSSSFPGRHWTNSFGGVEDDQLSAYGTPGSVVDVGFEGSYQDGALDHFARHDPARVLAECAAKRAIVELVRPYLVYQSTSDTSREFLQVLAAVYKDHPDYQQEWVK